MPHKIEGDRLALIIRNAHRILRHTSAYRGAPLWVMVRDLTGHGSTVSKEICFECGINPYSTSELKFTPPSRDGYRPADASA